MEEQYKAAMQAATRLIDEGYPELARVLLVDALEDKGEEE